MKSALMIMATDVHAFLKSSLMWPCILFIYFIIFMTFLIFYKLERFFIPAAFGAMIPIAPSS